jgi:hypothetical protein
MSKFGQMIEKRNFRIKGFCDSYGVGRTKFYQEVNSGRLKVVKAGHITLIPREYAEDWQKKLVEGLS